jgi:nucleoid DNA-binding protein
MSKRDELIDELHLERVYRASNLYQDLAKKLNLNYEDSRAILTLIMEYIKKQVLAGRVVTFKNFGKFYITVRRGKVNKTFYRHDRFQKTIYYRQLVFKPADSFKKLSKGIVYTED